MIIQSLLDTDLYKFTMMQVVLHHFPGAQVEYKFKCRTEGVDFRPYLDEIREEVKALSELRFRESELQYLRSLRFMKSDFVDFLGLFHFNDKYVRLGHGERPGEMDITIRGPWLHTIMYEIPVLAIASEVYFRRTQPRPDIDEGRRRLKAKIDLVRTVEKELDFRISDFGTRRRFSLAWHEEVLQTLKREVPEYFAGTSNVWFAMRNNTTPLGTMAHEYMQACQALGPRLRDSQTFAFDKWAQEYRGDLGTRLGRPIRVGREADRPLSQEPRRPAHQAADLLGPAFLPARHRHRAALARPGHHRVRHRHEPHQRPWLRADQHRHQDDRVQRPAGRQGVRFAGQDREQGRGLPALSPAGVRPRACGKDLGKRGQSNFPVTT